MAVNSKSFGLRMISRETEYPILVAESATTRVVIIPMDDPGKFLRFKYKILDDGVQVKCEIREYTLESIQNEEYRLKSLGLSVIISNFHLL